MPRIKSEEYREDLDRSTPDNVVEFRDVAAVCQFTTFASVSATELTAIVGSMYLKSSYSYSLLYHEGLLYHCSFNGIW